jgi:outer membrane protein assembly factor BamE (lipoprotein component of BamABCDE complex)
MLRIVLFSLILLSAGCASTRFGRDLSPEDAIALTEGLTGKNKEQVLTQLGVPDSVTRDGETEYWDYNNKCGFYLLLFGQTLEKDLVLDFKGGRVASSFLVDKGGTVGVLSSQGAVTR